MEKISAEILEIFKGLPYIGDVTSRVLYNEGFRSLKEVAEVDPEELAKVLDLDREKAREIVARASELLQTPPPETPAPEPEAAATPAPSGGASDPVDRIEGVGEKTAEVLAASGFETVQDVLNSDIEGLSALPGIGAKKAEKLIQSAQEYSDKGTEGRE
jgi:transcription termination factor NusA